VDPQLILMKQAPPVSSKAFSLVEMLVVIAVIAILTGLAVPAFQGLVGTSGVRGGVDMVSGAFDSARNLALEKNVNTYVGFLPETFDKDPAWPASHLIVFRDATIEELEQDQTIPYKPVSRWLKLPTGVMISFTAIDFDPNELTTSPEKLIPKFDNQDVANIRVIKFDRFGRIVTGPSGADNMQLEVGDAVKTASGMVFKANKRHLFTARRLTGKWEVQELTE
jgi:prepilin-type N-terminal cleavage/methylation domain-containing protein